MATTTDSNCVQSIPRAERIGRLNDKLRMTGTGGHIVVSRGVHGLAGFNAPELLKALAEYTDFDATNDPHGERGHPMLV